MSTTIYPWGSPIFSASNHYETGMAAPVAIAGTVAVTNGSAAVVGTSTLFTTMFKVGSKLQIAADTAGTIYTVSTITDDTHMALTATYAGTTNASTTINQYVALALCAGDYWLHAGVQITGTTVELGYMSKAGTPGLDYSTDGTTFSTVGAITNDGRFRWISIALGADATYNVWFRWNAATTSDQYVFNGDQFIAVTGSSPAIAAVAGSSNAPAGTCVAISPTVYPGKATAEGRCATTIFGGAKQPWSQFLGTDSKIRFKATTTEIWMLANGQSTSNWVIYQVDGVGSGATATPLGKVSTRNDSRMWWYRIASGLDGANSHEYAINYGSGTFGIGAIAVTGSFDGAATPSRGTCWALGDSIVSGFNNPIETFTWDLAETKNYSVQNFSVFGAILQNSYQPGIVTITNQFLAAGTSGVFQASSSQPNLIILNGGYNDANHDATVSATKPADAPHTQANFTAALTALLLALRKAAPTTKIVYLNIPPQGSSGASLRTTYNTLIANAITALADPLTVLADVSTLSPYYTCNTGATATATISGGAVTGFTGLSGGTGYAISQANITVSLVGGGGTGATAHATSNGSGVISAVTLDTGGSGYTAAPNVVIGHTYDQIHPNYNGYNVIWSAISSLVPTYSAASGGVRFASLGGGFRG